MTFLIIGSEGFIGQHFIKELTLASNLVIGLDLAEKPSFSYTYRRVSKLSLELSQLLQTYKFNVIINCAGSGNVPYSMEYPLIDFKANCFDTIKILDAIRLNNVGCTYIHISSAAVYGNPNSLPINENTERQPLSPYGWHKLMAENICREYNQLYGLKIAIIRPFSVFGPGLRKQLFWDLYQKSLTSHEIHLMGTGKETRDFIYVKDLIQATMLVILHGEKSANCYNIASGIETTIETAARLFFSIIKKDTNILFTGKNREGDPLNWRADISRIQKIGFLPSFSIEEGLLELSHWLNSTVINSDEKQN